jgi:hypothetical protein
LISVDEAICAFLGEPVHPTEYCHGWFDHLGWHYACGLTPNLIEADLIGLLTVSDASRYADEALVMLRINAFIRERYTIDSWREIGRGR